jgi:hypothetical protein
MSTRCGKLRFDWPLDIDTDMVLRAQGADPKRIRVRQPQYLHFVEEVLAECSNAMRPKAAIRTIGVVASGPHRIRLQDGSELRGSTLCIRLRGAKSVVAVVATIGDQLENRARESNLLRGFILDGIGTAAISTLTNSILNHLRASAGQRGRYLTNPLHPGMSGWELSQGQAQIFSLVDGREVGVSLNPSFMMTPVKSVSFLIGIGSQVATGPIACAECGAALRCRHKPEIYDV